MHVEDANLIVSIERQMRYGNISVAEIRIRCVLAWTCRKDHIRSDLPAFKFQIPLR